LNRFQLQEVNLKPYTKTKFKKTFFQHLRRHLPNRFYSMFTLRGIMLAMAGLGETQFLGNLVPFMSHFVHLSLIFGPFMSRFVHSSLGSVLFKSRTVLARFSPFRSKMNEINRVEKL
jgi:hypothetical protein